MEPQTSKQEVVLLIALPGDLNRTGNMSLLDVPDFDDTPFFTSQNYHELDPASKNLEWYLKYFPSIKDIPVLHHNPVLAGESLPHIQHYGLSHVNMESDSSPKDQKILVGECAPSYLHSDGASKRIAATIPEMKAVFIFRDPIDRAYLNYLEQSKPSYLACCILIATLHNKMNTYDNKSPSLRDSIRAIRGRIHV